MGRKWPLHEAAPAEYTADGAGLKGNYFSPFSCWRVAVKHMIFPVPQTTAPLSS